MIFTPEIDFLDPSVMAPPLGDGAPLELWRPPSPVCPYHFFGRGYAPEPRGSRKQGGVPDTEEGH